MPWKISCNNCAKTAKICVESYEFAGYLGFVEGMCVRLGSMRSECVHVRELGCRRVSGFP